VITKESKHNQNPSNRNRKWRNFVISFLIIFITFLTSAAFPVEEESLGDNEVSQRIEFIQLHLEKGSQHAKYWYYGWLGFFSFRKPSETFAHYLSDVPSFVFSVK